MPLPRGYIHGDRLPLPRGYIHIYDHYFQQSFSLKPLGESKPNFTWSLHGNINLQKWSRSHDQGGCSPFNGKNLSKSFPHNWESYDLKIGMQHRELELYEV